MKTHSDIMSILNAINPYALLTIGRNDDKNTWSVNYSGPVTEGEMIAVQNALDSITDLPIVMSQPSTSPSLFINLFTKAEKKKICKSNDEDVNEVWLDITSSTIVEPYGTKVSAGLAVLVTAGELTQARVDEILTAAKALADSGNCSSSYYTNVNGLVTLFVCSSVVSMLGVA